MKRNVDTIYAPASGVLLRSPALPMDDLAVDRQELAAVTPQFRRAVLIASPSLDDALEKGERARSRERYLKRMAGRATPFGLFSAVSVAKWSQKGSPRIETVIAKTRTRPDGAWLSAFVAQLESRDDVRSKLRWFWHEGAKFRGGHLALDSWSLEDEDDWIISSRAAAAIAQVALRGAGYEKLVEVAGGDENGGVEIVELLCRRGFLVSELRHPIVGDSIDVLCQHLQTCVARFA